MGIAGPAQRPPRAPSWADVQAAKSDQAESQQTVDELASRLSSLQDSADQAGVVVQQAGQTYALAASEQQEAQSTLDDLTSQAKRAKARRTSPRARSLRSWSSSRGAAVVTCRRACSWTPRTRRTCSTRSAR